MTAPTAPSPGLGEREAVARTFKRLLCKGACLTPETCAICVPKANNVADVFIAAHLLPLRTENETLRAERDAAIARAEEAERGIAQRDEMRKRLDKRIHCQRLSLRQNWEIVEMRMGVASRARDWRFARKRYADLKAATAKLAQAEGEISTMRGALEFYADPDTYAAIGFFPDRPCGEFVDDFSDEHDPGYPKPGKRARAALTNPEHPHGD